MGLRLPFWQKHVITPAIDEQRLLLQLALQVATGTSQKSHTVPLQLDKRPTVPAWQVQAPAPVTASSVVHTPPFRHGLEAQKGCAVPQVAPLKPGAHTHWKLFVLRLMTQLAPFWQRVRLAGHGMVLVIGATVGVVGMSQKRPVRIVLTLLISHCDKNT